MKIELKEISIRELTNGYEDNNDDGVIGYGGLLDIRPPYQREFIYNDKQREEVIQTIKKNFPLNVMYWALNNQNTFELIDGQQRTLSICQFVDGEFAVDGKYFHNLKNDEKDIILDYNLMIYICEGSDSEKLDWFKTINIAGEKLTEQELRNAIYSGPWVTDAKRFFSKTNCAGEGLGKPYLNGVPIRQDFFETTLKWISNDDIVIYMAQHQNDDNANEIWLYFQDVIKWVRKTFPTYRKEMKGIQWGFLYNQYSKTKLNPKKLEEEISILMMDDEVTNKKGIYEYVLNRKEKHLNIRSFTDNQKRETYERQKGICVVCKKKFELTEMEADHITPWHEGGKTSSDNCQMLCKEDNRRKSGI